jgi:hypothetical protein
MNRLLYLSIRAVFPVVGILAAMGLSTACAETQSGELRVKSVQGAVSYCTSPSTWLELKPEMVLHRGAILKTAADSSADLVLEYNGTALRMTPGTVLELARLDKVVAGEDLVTETSLNLKAGSVFGSQRKLAKPSKFEITVPGGVVTIRGTEYLVSADGSVTCFDGEVAVSFDSPERSGSNVQVPAGFSLNAATTRVASTASDRVMKLAGDLRVVQANARACHGSRHDPDEEFEHPISPTHGHDHDHDGDRDHGHGHDDGHGH